MVMIVVILLVLSLGICFSYRETKCNGKYNKSLRKYYIILVSIILALQSGLRNLAVGSDTYAYYRIFKERLSWSWSDIIVNFKTVYIDGEGKDAGYFLFQKIFQTFSDDYRLYLVVIAAMFFYALGRFIYKNTDSVIQIIFAYILYLALFYEFFSITGIRQTVATAIILYGFEYIKDKRLIAYIFICAIAFFIHKSSMVALLIYPLYWNTQSNKLYNIGLVVILFMFVFRTQIIVFFSILYYDDIGANKGVVTPPITFIAFMIISFCFTCINIRLAKRKDKTNLLRLSNICLLGFMLSPTIGTDSPTMRIVQYFTLYLLVLFPFSYELYEKQIRNLMYIISTILLVVVVIVLKNYDYTFFWQSMKLGVNYKFKGIMIE